MPVRTGWRLCGWLSISRGGYVCGRDFRPIEVIPLSAGFRDQRVRQRETQTAIYMFEDGVNVNQALTLTVEGVQNNAWDGILRTIERERSLIRSRAAK